MENKQNINKQGIEKMVNKYKKIRLTTNVFYFPELYIGYGVNNSVYYGKYLPKNIDLAIKFNDKKDNTFRENYITKKLNGIKGFPISYGCFNYKEKHFLHKLYLGQIYISYINFQQNFFYQNNLPNIPTNIR